MRLVVDGYNLLHAGRTRVGMTPDDLRREREDLIDQLALYRQARRCEITVVFDGWQGGWATEKKEKRKGVEVIFSRLGEKADEVIKRLLKERGPGTVLITSDQDISRYADRMGAAVIPSDPFRLRMEKSSSAIQKGGEEEDEGKVSKGKGSSRRLSKKERRVRSALKKL